MKTIRFVFLIPVVLIVLVISCQQEESPVDLNQQDLTQDWKKAAPETVFGAPENGFLISKEVMKAALNLPDVSTIRFVLEVADHKLQIRVAGVNAHRNKTQGLVADPVSVQKITKQLLKEKSVRFTTKALSASVAAHIMQPEDAVAFIDAWQQQWADHTLEDAITNEGERIRYFSMPADAAAHMLQTNPEGVNLVWGVNPATGKFTTVFLPKAAAQQRLLKSGQFIYEYSRPCPSTCPE